MNDYGRVLLLGDQLLLLLTCLGGFLCYVAGWWWRQRESKDITQILWVSNRRLVLIDHLFPSEQNILCSFDPVDAESKQILSSNKITLCWCYIWLIDIINHCIFSYIIEKSNTVALATLFALLICVCSFMCEVFNMSTNNIESLQLFICLRKGGPRNYRHNSKLCGLFSFDFFRSTFLSIIMAKSFKNILTNKPYRWF